MEHLGLRKFVDVYDCCFNPININYRYNLETNHLKMMAYPINCRCITQKPQLFQLLAPPDRSWAAVGRPQYPCYARCAERLKPSWWAMGKGIRKNMVCVYIYIIYMHNGKCIHTYMYLYIYIYTYILYIYIYTHICFWIDIQLL